MGTRTRFENEAKGISEMAYFACPDQLPACNKLGEGLQRNNGSRIRYHAWVQYSVSKTSISLNFLQIIKHLLSDKTETFSYYSP